jgi:hypothetical protein
VLANISKIRIFYYYFIEVFYRRDKAGGWLVYFSEEKMRVKKRFGLLSISVAVLVIIVGFSAISSNAKSSIVFACEKRGVVDKASCESFTVTISFKNTGSTEGTWSVNIAFEGEKWTWKGTAQIVALKSNKTKTLTWNGSVPCDAPIDSVSRLIVYYNNSFTRLDWWIHVVSSAELTITSSTVK